MNLAGKHSIGVLHDPAAGTWVWFLSDATLLSRADSIVLAHYDFTERYFFMRSLHTAALAAAILTVGNFTAMAAHAQDLALQSGDNVTVGGTGTSGTYLGAPISNTTSAYTAVTTVTNSEFTLNSGGSITGFLNILGISTANVTGGNIKGLSTYDTSTANVTGGSINDLYTQGTSTTNVSGGSITGFLNASSSGTTNVSGGSINGLSTYNTSKANVTGGSFTYLETSDTSVLDLFGTGFSETLLGSGSGYKTYNVMGTLQNSDLLNATYYAFGGTLKFNGVPAAAAVPEASTTASFGLLLALGLGGLVIAKKRKKQSA
jgi:hypothetical protein